jgi:phage tail sheath gpL-like
MAIKLFPKAGNGSKVTTYFMPVAAPSSGSPKACIKTLTAAGTVSKTFNGFIKLRDQVFEAAADVAGKVATNANNNPAKAPRGTDLNSFETKAIPFSLSKGMTAAEVAAALKSVLDEVVEIPFTAAIDSAVLTLTAKWVGSDSHFDYSITDENGDAIATATHGITLTTAETQAAAGVGSIPAAALSAMDEELGVTRVISQYATDTVLDALKEKFEAFRDGLIAQYVLCYSAIQAPENQNVPGTWDLATLISAGNARRADAINVQIVGDYGDLRKLSYRERDSLLKAGYSNLRMKADGAYVIDDLVTFYHPVGYTNPLYRFDRDVTVVGNIAYDLMYTFRDTEAWKSIVIIADGDTTVNPAARSLKDIKAAVNARIGLLGLAGLIADYAEAQKQTQVEIDSNNPNRININPKFEITGVGRIYDITNFIGFYLGS